jgi:hypothetical protein
MNRTAENFRHQVSTWSELAELIEHFSFFTGYAWLFRGVTDAKYGLIPKIGRDKSRAKKLKSGTRHRERVPYRFDDERAVFEMFKQQARPYLLSPPQSKLEWLAIAQHFELPTRLLDWTDSLLVAAWFAVENGGAGKINSAIWVSRDVCTVDMDYQSDPFDLPQPCCYRPAHISPRIAAQSSVFMICPTPTEELVLPFVRKIVIDYSAQFTIKKRLNACGINRRHLFPDIGGLSDHLTWLYKNDWLAGYRQDSKLLPSSSDDEPDEAVE